MDDSVVIIMGMGWRELPPVFQWGSEDVNIPIPGAFVIIACKDRLVCEAYLSYPQLKWVRRALLYPHEEYVVAEYDFATHWLPLPEHPIPESDNE